MIYSFSTKSDFALNNVVLVLFSFSEPEDNNDLFSHGILLINLSLLLEMRFVEISNIF
jgi:hypothetical protein